MRLLVRSVWVVLRAVGRLAWWQQLALAVCLPLAALNGAVGFFGQSLVFPLSPFYLSQKVTALRLYARHRPGCLLHLGEPDLAPLIARAERRHGLPRGLLAALVETESGSRAHRISPTGAMGPAQLMPGTARMLGVDDPFDAEEAVDAGARYLASLLERTHDVRLALASYNAGPGNVAGAVPRNGETEYYVARVMERYRQRR